MGPSIGWNFSFCLVPTSAQKACKMHFGDGAVVSGAGVVTTPIVTKNTGTFYHLTLVGMSVGSQRFDSDSSKKSVLEGNIVIDSGTTLTFLPRDLYGKVEAALKQQVSSGMYGDIGVGAGVPRGAELGADHEARDGAGGGGDCGECVVVGGGVGAGWLCVVRLF
ncbi:aspartic proteinase CDR1-like [Salvia splendens]|uniref:aspartic proteinase CDR1-like n=1 Tax=Salvia splendens TaxID=180675 RepID=UPI001C25290A|nr:aspartic proteinase CDR1-like [Salvia splendens]